MARASERAAARLAAVQALYEMDVTGKTLPVVFAEFETHWIGREIEGERYNDAELTLFRAIVQGVLENQEPLDRTIDKTLVASWPLARVDSVMRATLRGGAYELNARKDIPARVVIKEYVDIAAAFFGREESGMINAVLDGMARTWRADEFEGT